MAVTRNNKKYTKKVIVTDERSTPEARAERLRLVRNMANLTRTQMCDDGTININTLKGWEIGRYGGLPKDGAEKVCRRVANEGIIVSPAWLLYEIGEGVRYIPNFNYVRRNPEALANETAALPENEQDLIIQEIVTFRQHYRDTIDYLMVDDGMAPHYRAGDFVAGVKHYGKDIAKLLEQDCIVQTTEGETLLRRLRAGVMADHYHLLCINLNTTMTQPIVNEIKLTSAAPVMRHYRPIERENSK